jgi:cation diffusion facilitator CzcD-associated flavoprotein CzcO
VVGAGPAGIAVASSLRDRGVNALVLEQGAGVGWSWRLRYDNLKLNTSKHSSHLPGLGYPRGTRTFPSRDEFVEHLENGARGLDVRFNTAGERLGRSPVGWRLTTSAGAVEARNIVVATGYQRTPYRPKYQGIQGFTGDLLHSSEFRNPSRFTGLRVLVVGCGSSGMEIAVSLANGGAAKVWISTRTPPNILPRTGPAGVAGDTIARPLYHLPPRIADRIAHAVRLAAIGDLAAFGLPIPEEGPFARSLRLGVAPAIVDMEVIDAIKAGRIEVVAAPALFDGDKVVLHDGTQVCPDAVICATGYRPGLEALVGHLGVLDDRGVPLACRGESAAEGLRFLGFLPRPSQIGYGCARARRVAREIAAHLR